MVCMIGNTIVVDAHMPFGGLATFGGSFLSKFQCSQMPHPVSFIYISNSNDFVIVCA